MAEVTQLEDHLFKYILHVFLKIDFEPGFYFTSMGYIGPFKTREDCRGWAKMFR